MIVTLSLSIMNFLLILRAYQAGIVLVLVLLYFSPIFPKIDMGPLTFSATTLPMIGLALVIVFRSRMASHGSSKDGGFYILPIVLGLAFLLTTLTSFSILESLPLFLHLMLYVFTIFAILALVRKPDQLMIFAKAILVILVFQSLWKFGFRPVRMLFELPSLGTNGLVFTFYPAFALCLILVLKPLRGFSQRWVLLAWVGLAAIALQTIYYETRAGIIAQSAMLLIALAAMPSQRKPLLILGIAGLVVIIATLFSGPLQRSINDTIQSVQEYQSEEASEHNTDADNYLRIVSRQISLEMFRLRPLRGWGPGMLPQLRPEFGEGISSRFLQSSLTGTSYSAFNSWLMLLAEMGVLTTFLVALLFLLPLPLALREMRRRNESQAAVLAFAFALGLIGLSIHLYFIDLIYGSFVWVFVALAWAGVRIAREENSSLETTPEQLQSPEIYSGASQATWSVPL